MNLGMFFESLNIVSPGTYYEYFYLFEMIPFFAFPILKSDVL
jgi:hypothetical protein